MHAGDDGDLMARMAQFTDLSAVPGGAKDGRSTDDGRSAAQTVRPSQRRQAADKHGVPRR
jgi:hypothetical protein